jgi:Zn-dependent protease with chaperone function
VAPVLDPGWQNPYSPSTAERHANQHAVRSFALRKRLPITIVVLVVAIALFIGSFVSLVLPLLGVVLIVVYGFYARNSLTKFEHCGFSLGTLMLDTFTASGTTTDRQRLIIVLDRLAATFGVDAVSAFIVEDPGYNATLVPNGTGLSFFITDSMMRDFELIEIEGVVAHCLARHRLGLLNRESVASVASLSEDARSALAGTANAYRADEVAAAAIRYPLGLAGALRKCSRQVLPSGSFFSTATYASWRWIWFDVWSDRDVLDMSDLDDVELRARALEEW